MPNIRMGQHDFEPAIFNDAELDFLLMHMEEAPAVAFHKSVPAGVNPPMVQRWIEKFFNLEQIRLAHGQEWSGFAPIKDSILRYMKWQERCQEIRRRSGGRLAQASMFSYDSVGGFSKYGIDSDSGFVRTEILPDGSRRPFVVKLLEVGGKATSLLHEVAPWLNSNATGSISTARQLATFNDDLIVERKGQFGKFECSICGKGEEFSTRSKNTENMARARIGKHLKTARVEIARHRALYRKRYESPDVKL